MVHVLNIDLGNKIDWPDVKKTPCDIGGAKEPGMMYFPTKFTK